MNTEEKLIFLHIPRTAGTTLLALVGENYPDKECLRLYYPSYPPEVIRAIQTELPKTKVLYGHIHFGIHQVLGIQGKYTTFLRDPYERVISFYDYNACSPKLPYYGPIQKGMSLLEMLQSEITEQTNNHMSRIIANYTPKDMLDDDHVLEQAIKNIEEHFCFIGLTEKLAESVKILGQKLGWKILPKLPRLHPSTTRRYFDECDIQTQDALKKYNRLDRLLYDYVKSTVFPSMQR